jgi:3-oxoacyl-[acyl-carrier protein] reductase
VTGPVAVVTGGTRGIGLAFSRRLVKLGHRVAAFYRDDEAAAAAAVAELGPALWPLPVDVADPVAVEAAAATVLAELGTPRVLVNNAGVNLDRPFLEMTTAGWDRVLATNLSGPFHLCRVFAPAMLDAGGPGVIVNVGATTGMRVRRNGADYSASKAGLLQLTKCLALELAPRVRVCALIPGMTGTPELTARYRLDDPAARAEVEAGIPAGRIGSTEEMADALEFLIGPGAAYLTGQKLIVDGGQFMW